MNTPGLIFVAILLLMILPGVFVDFFQRIPKEVPDAEEKNSESQR